MRTRVYRLGRNLLIIMTLVFGVTGLAADETACIRAARINAELEKIGTELAANQAVIDNMSLRVGSGAEQNLIDRFLERKNLKEMHRRIEKNEQYKRRQKELHDQRGRLGAGSSDRSLEILCGVAEARNLEETNRQRDRLRRVTNVEEKMRTEKRLLELVAERDEIEKQYIELNKFYREKSP